MKFFEILVVTAETEIFCGMVTKVVVGTQGGELGIYAGHAPLLAILRPGSLRVERREDRRGGAKNCLEVVVHGGFIEVQPNRVIVLADAIERAADLDVAKTVQAVKLAKSMLSRSEDSQIDLAMTTLQLELARYHVACRGKGIMPSLKF